MAAYSDAEMLLAAQLAYIDFSDRHSGQPISKALDSMYRDLKSKGSLSKAEEGQLSTIENARHFISQYGLEEANNWVVRDTCNHNSGSGSSGMYALLFDTNDGNAIVGYRGSENYDSEQLGKDWGESDFGLLNNNGETPQQVDAREFMQKIADQYGDQYGTIGATGHSLGGNLASHAVITADETISSKMECINFDGPGNSDEYYRMYKDQVEQNGSKVTHYKWSIVGELLFDVPGSRYMNIKADTPTDSGNVFFSEVNRHSIVNVIIDEEGNVIPGEIDDAAAVIGPSSIILDAANKPLWAGIPPTVITLAVILANGAEEYLDAKIDEVYRWFRENFGHPVRGDFETDTNQIGRGAMKYDSIRKTLSNLAEEVNRIERNIKFQSLGTSYVKLTLFNLQIAVRTDSSRTGELAYILWKAQKYYDQTDLKVEDLFY